MVELETKKITLQPTVAVRFGDIEIVVSGESIAEARDTVKEFLLILNESYRRSSHIVETPLVGKDYQ